MNLSETEGGDEMNMAQTHKAKTGIYASTFLERMEF
jgi:hypothetical protein